MRWKTARASVSGPNVAPPAGTDRDSHSGTPDSATISVMLGTWALRKYFSASMLTAIWDQSSGAIRVMSYRIVPSRPWITDRRLTNSMPA